MNSANYRVRRATLDDMSALMALWKSMNFPADELSKRVTDFQVAEGAEGQLLGCLGVQIAEKQGRIHSEAFTDFGLSDQLRPMLWDRVHSVAVNHGLLRLWTQEKAPFWNHCGLLQPDAEAQTKLPALWRTQPAGWLTLKLKDDLDTVLSTDQEFSMFMAAEKERTARTFQHARILKIIATLIALALLFFIMTGAFIVLKHNPHLLGR
jgi:N-acetylglutamate synthase-like GNAT family acetyltransferase